MDQEVEAQRLIQRISGLDTRVSVLEAKFEVHDQHMANMNELMEETRKGVDFIRDMLGDHVLQEEKDRSRFYYGIIFTLLAASGSLVAILVQHLLRMQP